jgi:hypothetical protein
MTAILDRLLGLKELSLSGEGVAIEFARGMPAWGWVLVGGGLALYAGWSYWKLVGNPAARTGLAILRFVLLLLLALLIAGPQVAKQIERIEKDWIVVLVDRSASMNVRDAPPPLATRADQRVSRDEQELAGLEAAMPALTRLQTERNVLLMGFDAGAFELPLPASPDTLAQSLGEAKGPRTALGSSLEQTLKKVAARPVAGIVLLSDGRSFDTPSRAVLQELEERQIPVYPYPLGSAQALADVAIARVDAPQAAFIGDLVPVVVDVDALGLTPGDPRPTGTLQLLDANGAVLDEKPLPTLAGEQGRITLTTKVTTPGRSAWTVRVVTTQPDLTNENNTATLALDLVDRPLRVLYIDGYPRWEYRYLKNLLLREASIRSTTLLLSAEKRFLQEGTDRLSAMPVTTQDWAAFDVIILGDVRPGLLSHDQLTGLRDLVATRGAGLLWIGGPSFTPTAWPASPLGDLLPFRLGDVTGGGGGGGLGATARDTSSSGDLGVSTSQQPMLLLPGPAASVYGLLRLDDDPAQSWPQTLSDASLGWPLLRWSQRIDVASLKPSAEVLALGQPIAPDGSRTGPATPLLMTMRYGAGRAAYVATDETWRYRYGRGEALTERFWIPLVRLLARGSLGRSGKPALLEATPQTALTNQPVRVQLTLLDQALLEKRLGDTQVRVLRVGDDADRATTVALQARREDGGGGSSDSDPPRDSSSSLASFVGTWVPDQPGEYELKPIDASLAGLDLSTRVRVVLPEDELRRPQTDHPALASLAEQTGGAMLRFDQLPTLDTLLPNRQLRVLGNPQIETLWDKPLSLILIMLLLTLEWAGRRLIKLS